MTDAELAVRSITWCVTLRGAQVTQDSPAAGSQHMLIILAETGNSDAARIIAQAARPASCSWFAAVSTAAAVQGIPSVETQASLERFRHVLGDALAIGAGQDEP